MFSSDYKLIAVCIADINSNYNDKLLRALSHHSGKYNYKIIFFSSFSSLYHVATGNKHEIGESSIFNLINYNILDAVIILSETVKCEHVLNNIVKKSHEHKLPVFTIDHPLEGCYNIGFDYRHSIEDIIIHMIEVHGYKKINFIAGIQGNPYSEERLDIYRSVLARYNIPIEEERIGYGGFWSLPTKKVIDDFVHSSVSFPEAIICANDTMAVASLYYLAEYGIKVPDDVAITGFDGIPEAVEHIPPITTIEHDYDEIVIQVYEKIRDYFNNREIPKETLVKSKILLGTSCGCKSMTNLPAFSYSHKVYRKLDDYKSFNNIQIIMTADLTDNNSFQGVFESLMKYSSNFFSRRFWMCIVDNFLIDEEELSDIIEEKSFRRNGYSGHMDLMLSKNNNEWQGMTDFETTDLLPDLKSILEEEGNIMFLPLHVLDHTIGYVAIVYDADVVNMEHLYQFLMNVSTALETTKTHQRQQNIISNLENKYIHDPLTGLFNRRGFYQRVTPIYEKCIETQSEIFVASIDLNGLKVINDTYGHADGDIAISTVGKALNAVIKGDETCARFGGDEYVLAGSLQNSLREETFKKEFQQYIDNFNETSNKPYKISASIGVIVGIPSHEITLDEFIKFADEEMYKEKVKHHMQRTN